MDPMFDERSTAWMWNRVDRLDGNFRTHAIGVLHKVAGRTTAFAYDDADNRVSVDNPDLGSAVAAADGGGTVSVKFAYNGYGELETRTDARGETGYE